VAQKLQVGKFPLTKQEKPSIVWFTSYRWTWGTKALPKFNAGTFWMPNRQERALSRRKDTWKVRNTE